MSKKGLIRIAAALMISAGVLNIIWAAIAISGVVDPKEAVRFSWIVSPLPYFGVAAGFTGRAGLSDVLAFAYLAGILAAIAGGIIYFFRSTFVPWTVGTTGALLCLPLLGIASIVMTGLSRSRSDG